MDNQRKRFKKSNKPFTFRLAQRLPCTVNFALYQR